MTNRSSWRLFWRSMGTEELEIVRWEQVEALWVTGSIFGNKGIDTAFMD